MDQALKELLKRDLFVQGFTYKWQEKVLPSASSFGDALHQARLAEEQHKQLNELYSRHSTDKVQPRKPSGKEESSKDGNSETTRPVPPKDIWHCTICGSLHHKARDCRQRQHSSEAPGRDRTRTSTSSVITAETLEDHCKRLQEEWTAAECQKMARKYQSYAGVD